MAAPTANFSKSDMFVLVTGLVGAGKSTFINQLLDGEPTLPVGESTNACTVQMEHRLVTHPWRENCRLVLVETPGFDQHNREDQEVLNQMDSWVQEFIPKGARVGGIFLHDISTKRRSARSRGPLILEKWSGQDKVQLHPGAIRVATTNWNASASDPGADARHTELENTEWKRFTVHKFKGSATDAWRIVDDLIDTLLGLPLPPIIDKFAGDIILLIGQTGSGRSNFAKVADESCTAVVNDKQTSTSMEINYYTVSCSRPSRSVVLVEAPGFDHLEKSDAETLACIAKWLKTFCTRDTTLAGIIYFHDITKDRLGASYGQVWLDHLSPETARHLLLVSTKWDRGGSSTREEELKSGAWKSAICRGAKVRRFENTNEAAWRIIDDLLGVQPRLDLHKVTRGLSGVQNKGEADAKMRH